MNYLLKTYMTYLEEDGTITIIFPSKDLNRTLYTMNDVVENEALIEASSSYETYYAIVHAIQNAPCVKVVDKDKYLDMWLAPDSDWVGESGRITRFSNTPDHIVQLEEEIKELANKRLTNK